MTTQSMSKQALQAKVLELHQKLEQQSLFIDQLLEQIRLARHQHFGTRSERYSLDQMALAFNEAEAAVDDENACALAQANGDAVVVPRPSPQERRPPAPAEDLSPPGRRKNSSVSAWICRARRSPAGG